MLNNIKALVMVFAAAMLIFWLARKYLLAFIPEADFIRRRNVWLLLTVVAFLSPSIWLYLLVLVPVLVWAGRKDPNPAALVSALGFVAPDFALRIPKLFPVSILVFLMVCIGIPALARMNRIRREEAVKAGGLRSPALYASAQSMALPTALLFIFAAMQTLPWLEIYSVAEIVRNMMLLYLYMILPFYLFSRTVNDRKALLEVIACQALAYALLGIVGVCEAVRGWLLYSSLADYWGVGTNTFAYLMRAGQLRAMSATGHSLALGFCLAIGFALCVYLKRLPGMNRAGLGGSLVMWAGMFAAYSRGPWIAALLMMFMYLWLLPHGTSRIIRTVFALGLVGAMMLPTPLGQKVMNVLPFFGGSVETENVDYRQQLLKVSLDLIPNHPWFGDIHVQDNMESLRQGQGIIDIVNGYLFIALHYGLVTLGVWILFVLIAWWRIWVASRRCREEDADLSAAGSMMLALIVGHMFFAWTSGISGSLYVWAGIGLAYAKFIHAERAARPRELRTASQSVKTGAAALRPIQIRATRSLPENPGRP